MDNWADVLIVEDERKLRFFVSEIFRLEEIAAAAVADGCQAMAYFQDVLNRDGNMPRVVILDMTMPCMGGLEVYKQIAQQPWMANTTIIITSATGENIKPLPGAARTMDLHKPYEVSGLLDTVREAAPDLFKTAPR
jgi:CheY-like chemotaxis protein